MKILYYMMAFLVLAGVAQAQLLREEAPPGVSMSILGPGHYWHMVSDESTTPTITTTDTYETFYPRFDEAIIGDVAGYKIPYGYRKRHGLTIEFIVHRIVEIDRKHRCYYFRGDNNEQRDPWCIPYKDVHFIVLKKLSEEEQP